MTLIEDILKLERLDALEKKEKPLTTRSLYDCYGEPVSASVWDKRLQEIAKGGKLNE